MMSQVGNAYLSKKFRGIYSALSEEDKSACLNLVNAYLGKDETGKARKVSLDDRKAKGDQIINDVIMGDADKPRSIKGYSAIDQIKEVFDTYRIAQSARREKSRANSLKGQIEQWKNKYSPEISTELGELVNAYQGINAQGKRSHNINSYESRYEKANGIVNNLKDADGEVKKATKELSNIFSTYEVSKSGTSPLRMRNILREENKEALSSLEDAVNNYVPNNLQGVYSDSKKGFFSRLYSSAKRKWVSATAAGLATIFLYGCTLSNLPVNPQKAEANISEESNIQTPDLSTPEGVLKAIQKNQEDKDTAVSVILPIGTEQADQEVEKDASSEDDICVDDKSFAEADSFMRAGNREAMKKRLRSIYPADPPSPNVGRFIEGGYVKVVVDKEHVEAMEKNPDKYILVLTDKGRYESDRSSFIKYMGTEEIHTITKLNDPKEDVMYIGVHDRSAGESVTSPEEATTPKAVPDPKPESKGITLTAEAPKPATPEYQLPQKPAEEKKGVQIKEEKELKNRFDVKWEKSPLEKGIRGYKLDKKGNLEVTLNKALTKAMNEDERKYLLVKTNKSAYETNTMGEKKGLGKLSLKLDPKEKIEYLGIEKRETDVKDNTEVTTMTYFASISAKKAKPKAVMAPGQVTAEVAEKKAGTVETKDLRIAEEAKPERVASQPQPTAEKPVPAVPSQSQKLADLEGKLTEINYRNIGRGIKLNRIDITERKGLLGNIQESEKKKLENTSLDEEILKVVGEKKPSYIFVDSRVSESYGKKSVPKLVFEFGNNEEDGRRLEKVTDEQDATSLDYKTAVKLQGNKKERLFEKKGFQHGMQLNGKTPEVIAQQAADFFDFEVKKAQEKNLLATPWHKRDVQRSNPSARQPLQAHFVVGQSGTPVGDIAAIVVTADGMEVNVEREGRGSTIEIGAPIGLNLGSPGGVAPAAAAPSGGGSVGPGGPGTH